MSSKVKVCANTQYYSPSFRRPLIFLHSSSSESLRHHISGQVSVPFPLFSIVRDSSHGLVIRVWLGCWATRACDRHARAYRVRVVIIRCYWVNTVHQLIQVVFGIDANVFEPVTTEARLRLLQLLLRMSAVNVSSTLCISIGSEICKTLTTHLDSH